MLCICSVFVLSGEQTMDEIESDVPLGPFNSSVVSLLDCDALPSLVSPMLSLVCSLPLVE